MRKNYWKSNLLIIFSHLTLFLFRSLSWWMATPPATTNWAGILNHPMPSLSLFPTPNRFWPYLLKSSDSPTLTRIVVTLCPLGSWVGSHIRLLIPSWNHLLYELDHSQPKHFHGSWQLQKKNRYTSTQGQPQSDLTLPLPGHTCHTPVSR